MSAPTDAEFTPLLGAEPAPGDARSARRTSARVTALGAALSVGAVAAIACAGLGGGSALAALGAPGVVPGARPAGDTLALHPGDDFWDVVDRGFAETRRQARAAAGAAIGLVRTPSIPTSRASDPSSSRETPPRERRRASKRDAPRAKKNTNDSPRSVRRNDAPRAPRPRRWTVSASESRLASPPARKAPAWAKIDARMARLDARKARLDASASEDASEDTTPSTRAIAP